MELLAGRKTIVTAAIIGAGVVGAAGSAIAGSEAASATGSAANTAAAEQQSALTQQEALAAPYTQLGQSAIPQLQTLLGLTPTNPTASNNAPSGYTLTIGPNGTPVMIPRQVQSTAAPAATAPTAQSIEQALAATPGYQFTLNQGLNATKNAASASGMLLSGNTLQALDQYGSGLADQTYQQAVGNLENTVNTGQAAAAGQAANIGNAATNLGRIAINQGNTLAGIDTNTIAGVENAIGGGVNNAILANTLSGLGNPGIGSDYYSSLSDAGVADQIGYPATLNLGP